MANKINNVFGSLRNGIHVKVSSKLDCLVGNDVSVVVWFTLHREWN